MAVLRYLFDLVAHSRVSITPVVISTLDSNDQILTHRIPVEVNHPPPSNVIFDGLTFQATKGGVYFNNVSGSVAVQNVTFVNCTFASSNTMPDWNAVDLEYIDGVHFLFNKIQDPLAPVFVHPFAHGLYLTNSNYAEVEGNDISGCSNASGLLMIEVMSGVVRNNRVHDNLSNLLLHQSSLLRVEGNDLYCPGEVGDSTLGGASFEAANVTDSVFRFNRIADGCETEIGSSARDVAYFASWWIDTACDSITTQNRVYQNVFFGKTKQAMSPAKRPFEIMFLDQCPVVEPYASTRNVFKNNVFSHGVQRLLYLENPVAGFDFREYFEGNLVGRGTGEDGVIGYNAGTVSVDYSVAEADANIDLSDRWDRNRSGDPSFKNIDDLVGSGSWVPELWDFHLKAGSAAIDSGVALTTTSGAGTAATTMTVGDARFFVAGDWILIGEAGWRQIDTVNYVANQLTLKTAATWPDGAGITLGYLGAAPDIGAYEY